ncbi:carbon-nitrogen hydrolase family protein [Lentibacillus jeotgali]|uniref:carbon-nitrogen hydrolase family protein n=1 Tax=Lentibacillus jeotgali TaxID=558169 RepID=UPI00026283FB|nr:carbon-nitrogen hydrolase family protein [Lentibacillus jeotgali]
MENKMKVCGIQMGPYPGDSKRNWYKIEKIFEEVMVKESPNLIVFSELMTTPYFATKRNENFFKEFSETMEGETVQKCMNLSLTYNTHVIGTLFEEEPKVENSNYYNSAFVCSPTKGLIGKYRKVHLPKVISKSLTTDEKFYFEQFGSGGDEFPVFTLDNGFKIGILICFDRSFPEAWRSLSSQGVDLVVIPTATFGFRKDLFVQELRIRAMENNVYVLGVNKSGEESMKDEPTVRNHFGASCIIDPFGDVINELSDDIWTYLTSEIDLESSKLSKDRVNWLSERKPEIYNKYIT